LAACQGAGVKKVSLDQAFTLAPGKRAEIGEQGLSVTFIGVNADSRCPVGSTCVWQGQVQVRLGFGDSQQDILEGRSTVVGQYRITVLKVNPEPVKDQQISPAQYRVTLKLEQQQAG
jgi:hypothetical protein